MDTLKNRIIRGYELRELIGTGGFGAVYKAYQPTVGREVAIKVILPEHASQPDFIRGFEAEAQLVARLEHPFIVPMYDYWRDPDGAYLVMRYLPFSLYDRIKRDGPLSLNDAVRMVETISGALAAAHRSDVIHRDLKPENILLDHDGNAYLSDFGIAMRLLKEDDSPSQSAFTGSVEYASPELFRGELPTPRSDIYGFGYLLHRILTGHPIINERSISKWVTHHLYDPLPHNDRIPLAVYAVLERATQKDSAGRYASIIEMAAAFRAAVYGGEPQNISPIISDDRQIPNPYKGLRAFDETDANDFFGREALVSQLVEHLESPDLRARFLAVVGPSGSGKSSLVKAGMLPALRQGRIAGSEKWFFLEMTPGSHPFEKLASVLLTVATSPPGDLVGLMQSGVDGLTRAIKQILPPGQELVLLIDQFEEIFTLIESDPERHDFLAALVHTVHTLDAGLRLIITLRADFYDRPLMVEQIASLIRLCTEVVIPLNTSEIERAIVEPARRVGLNVDQKLVNAIIADLRDEPGTLPLLQYVLTEVFERRAGSTLNLSAYQATGGALKALARRADELYVALSPVQQHLMRQVFMRLVTLGDGAEDTRRRVLLSELYSVAADRHALNTSLDTFGKYRLLTFDNDPETREPTIEIAHEALIREWGRMQQWLDESRGDLRLQRILSASCTEWLASGKNRDFLLTGGRLSQFDDWFSRANVALTQDELTYLNVSVQERDSERARELERQAHELTLEARARTRLRLLAYFLTLGVIVALLLTAYAFSERQNALMERQNALQARAESERSALLSSEIAMITNSQLSQYRDDNLDLAIMLALEAQKVGLMPDAEYRAISEAAFAPGTRRVYSGHTGRIYHHDLSADGTRIVSGAQDKTIRLWDVQTGESLRTFEGHNAEVLDVRFSPDETRIVSASLDGAARIWDVETGEQIHLLDMQEIGALGAVFSPDGESVATILENGVVRVWDAASGDLRYELAADNPDTEEIEGHSRRLWAVNYSPDGQYLLTGGEDNHLFVWNAESGEMIREFLHRGTVFSVTFSPDSTRIVTTASTRAGHIWDFETGQELLTLTGHSANVYTAAYSPDGNTVLTVAQDKSIRLWNARTGAEIRRFIGHSDRVFDVEFLPDGAQFITSSYDTTLRLWDLTTDDTIQKLVGHESTIYQVSFNADESRLISTGADGTIRLWDSQTGELLRTFDEDDDDTDTVEGHSEEVLAAAFSPDETRIVSVGDAGEVLMWDAQTGQVLRVFAVDDPETGAIEGHATNQTVWHVVYAPDGQSVFTASFDMNIIRWDAETGDLLQVYAGHKNGVTHLSLLDDGRRLLSTSWDRTIRLWDVETGEVIRTYEGHTDWVWHAAISPDGKTFATSSGDFTLILWDLESGALLRRFSGHTDAVLTSDFSPDGQWLISAGRDSRPIMWNVATGELMHRYVGHVNWVRGLDYSADSHVFASGGNDSIIRLWHVRNIDEMLQWVYDNRFVRELTCAERVTYRIEPLCEDVSLNETQ